MLTPNSNVSTIQINKCLNYNICSGYVSTAFVHCVTKRKYFVQQTTDDAKLYPYCVLKEPQCHGYVPTPFAHSVMARKYFVNRTTADTKLETSCDRKDLLCILHLQSTFGHVTHCVLCSNLLQILTLVLTLPPHKNGACTILPH